MLGWGGWGTGLAGESTVMLTWLHPEQTGRLLLDSSDVGRGRPVPLEAGVLGVSSESGRYCEGGGYRGRRQANDGELTWGSSERSRGRWGW